MTALNPEALEAIARAICCPDGSCPKWNSCTWKDWIPEANAAAVALHASEPDAVAVEREAIAQLVEALVAEHTAKALSLEATKTGSVSGDEVNIEQAIAYMRSANIRRDLAAQIRARSQP